MTNTPANRMYAIAATSHGVVNKQTTTVDIPTIFDELQQANISWKVYVPDFPNGTALKGFPAYAKYLNTNIELKDSSHRSWISPRLILCCRRIGPSHDAHLK